MILQDDEIDFDLYMRDTDAKHKVKPASHWDDELIDEFSDQGQDIAAPRLPWSRLANKIALRPAEMSVWFGYNGHGKSLLLGQAMLSLCAQGEKVCVASFEMRPRKTLGRMARQFTQEQQPNPSKIREFTRWAQGKLWLYDQTATVDPEKVYAVIRYAADQLGVTHFVVDNLTKCVSADDDYVGQKAITDKLHALAQALNIHVHLVHHARKGQDETRPPRKMDALGASAITNLVDNVFIVWRNKAKAEAELIDNTKPDAVLICDKQRHGSGWEGILNLNCHFASQQYIEFGYQAMDMSFYPHSGYREAA